ncbi:hypothetical protein GUJ93_ZPchr0013g35209 [Zizania palustris]|uniref:Uncharacterized protein n=1 Tax=Zizania palustris TaxID=103762 RepID=A0A8J5WW76_ZIZPA|nr:hypothetical protein GUJ93_ZPchr0013g35209 [Zizania palustris]
MWPVGSGIGGRRGVLGSGGTGLVRAADTRHRGSLLGCRGAARLMLAWASQVTETRKAAAIGRRCRNPPLATLVRYCWAPQLAIAAPPTPTSLASVSRCCRSALLCSSH